MLPGRADFRAGFEAEPSTERQGCRRQQDRLIRRRGAEKIKNLI